MEDINVLGKQLFRSAMGSDFLSLKVEILIFGYLMHILQRRKQVEILSKAWHITR